MLILDLYPKTSLALFSHEHHRVFLPFLDNHPLPAAQVAAVIDDDLVGSGFQFSVHQPRLRHLLAVE